MFHVNLVFAKSLTLSRTIAFSACDPKLVKNMFSFNVLTTFKYRNA